MRIRGLVALLLAGLAACGGEAPAPSSTNAADADARPVVVTTFAPTACFARRIAGDAIDVRCPVPEGEDPIFWQPSREVLERYRAADLVIVNGAQYEKWVATASLPSSRVIDTADGFRGAWLVHPGAVTHSHGPAGAHTHEGIDGHTWLDPVQAQAQAEVIARAFQSRFPEHASEFAAGLRALDAALADLDARWTSLAPRLRARRVLASHPAYDYVARRYGFALTNVLLAPEDRWDGSTATLVSDALAQAEPAGAPALLLWESAPRPEVVDALRTRLGVTSVVVTPAENPSPAELTGDKDVLDLLSQNLDRLDAALGDG
ncbi:MAG: zinc ABC transporter substrate-binding protein [Planctomycetes bacterium]|nr:zinc ABC transporter substrate-binding protein [Planctomycetota bacterium]